MYDDRERAHLAIELALAMLTGPWTATAVAEAGAATLEHWPSWLDALALRVTSVHRRAPSGARLGDLVRLIEAFLAERHAGREHDDTPPRLSRLDRRPALRHDWPLAAVPSVGDLAAALELSDGQLAWLADVRGLERTVTAERLRNYRYAAIPRRSGLPRVIEAPKLRLKEVQRWILREILDHVPVHEAALGFVPGRSVIDHARHHSGRHVVLRLDLADFFASVSAGRVFGIFRTLGYDQRVAHALTGLTTNTVPLHVWQVVHEAAGSAPVMARFHLGRALATPHLPQGAPTSPALANLAAFRLDRRLSGLAAGQGLRYSRYADDLTFSGARLRRRGAGIPDLVARIAREEGFAINGAKTALRTTAARQSVCGIVVNVSPNVSRAEYDRLKAILHNAARHGPASQGDAADRAHLEGRIAWVASLNPARGEKLRRRCAQIDWSA
ncbi:MAG: reverse transcriptase family protein [Solirubrobacteraceae bacterium]